MTQWWNRLDVMAEAEPIRGSLDSNGNVKAAYYTGSCRREDDMVQDVDVLVVAKFDNRKQNIVDAVVNYASTNGYPYGGEADDTPWTVWLEMPSGCVVGIVIVGPDEEGGQSMWWTGSCSFNVKLRLRAWELDYTLDPNGLRDRTGTLVADTEDAIFTALGWTPVAPNERDR